jgi:hypothetical protein
MAKPRTMIHDLRNSLLSRASRLDGRLYKMSALRQRNPRRQRSPLTFRQDSWWGATERVILESVSLQ